MRVLAGYVIKTKFLTPGSSKKYWKKPELWEKYAKMVDYPLTVVKAGPGYGKSTTIAAFFKDESHHYWYNVDEMDADAAVFFLNVFSAFHVKNGSIGQSAIDILTDSADNSLNIERAIDYFINDASTNLKAHTYLILDDFHLVAGNTQITELLARFIKMMPPKLHLIICTRESLKFKEWASWRLKKMVLVIDEGDLSLTSRDIMHFFEGQYGIMVSHKDAEKVAAESEGWIIALDLLGQGLSHGTELDQVLGAESLDLLFEYLAYEVLENQSAKVQEFLLKTAVLKNLRIDICNQLLETEDSQDILEQMKEKGFFIYVLTPDLYRYHHLVREFLLKVGKEQYDYDELHKRSAEICFNLGETSLAIYHSLEAKDYQRAAALIISSADNSLQLGRIDSLQTYLDELPDEVFSRYPQLYVYKGEVLRLKSMFNKALEVFEQARQIFLARHELLNVSTVSQKIAMVYLDTVQPVKAREYLQEALKYRGKDNFCEEAALLKLIAENKANKGQLDQALALQKRAQELDHQEMSDSNIKARVFLRTGRLDKVIRLLQGKLADEKKREMIPRSHRETVLILSFTHSLKGDVKSAHDYAAIGVELGQQLSSPFITAVAYMRLGHSLQLRGGRRLEEARGAYHEALKLVDEIDISRGRAEPLLGLSLLEGFHGDSNLGLKYGDEGLAITRQSGDRWLGGMCNVALGINHHALNEFDQAVACFKSAVIDFTECQDFYCQLISKLWLSLTYFHTNQITSYDELVGHIFAPQNKEYNFLFTKPTLLGIRDTNVIAPLLVDAAARLKDNKFLHGLVAEKGLADVDYHPGYSLRVESFGNLRLWKGKEEISGKKWQREKALELFLLLFINRGKLMPKETIYYSLWPNDDEESAARNFKVSLNALKKALEPDRAPQQESFFVIRNRSSYGFNENSGYRFDAEEFERLLAEVDRQSDKKAQIECYEAAIELYQGDFMADMLYVDWIDDERERLRNLFLKAGDELARHYYDMEENETALKMADLLLEHDPCWEPAYLLKMKVYNRLKRPFVAARVYQQCRAVLDRELNVMPMPELEKYYQELTSQM